ncbi:MAG TPA: ubiquinone biosynthesis regulatory protein kinase UbiB [Pseudomonadales bacterium]|nr:ubiquinone biosynthesis regulatory protein kinase UbiB [Pseudomonadales bacterium]
MALLRLFTILRVLTFYRLDSELLTLQLPVALRLALRLSPLQWLPRCDTQLSRGARMRLVLEQLGPVFVKFGQLLSTRPDLVSEDIGSELDRLQDRVPPFASAEFVAIVESALGKKISDLFFSFEHEPLASASVAQVHCAVLTSGEEVVVKVIRPGIAATIEKDLALMDLLAKLVERFVPDGRRLRPVEVVQDYRLTIFDELNLQRESANAAQLRRNFDQSPMLYVPKVYWDYCRPQVMVMERIRGIPVTDLAALTAQGTDMKLLAHRGVEIFFMQVFDHNFFHADMHPGNIFVSTQHPSRPQYIAIDCAIVGSLSRDDQYYLARNLLAIFQRDYNAVAQLHIECGWVPPDTRAADFESAIRTVCEPIFEKPISEISFGQILVNLFQTARRFDMTVQPSLVLLQKTLLNIEGLGRQLYPQLDLWQTAMPFLERWMQNRYHPKNLLAEIRKHGPGWLEKMPEVPELLFDAAQQIRRFEQVAPAIQSTAQQMLLLEQRQQQTRKRSRVLAGVLVAAGLLWPYWGAHLAAVPWQAVLLMAAGAWWFSSN